MKKISYFIIGIAVGSALTLSASVAAQEVKTLIGKQIDSEYTVTLNGKELTAKAGAIEGTSYLPVRAVSEALGLDVGFDEKAGISLKNKKEVTEVSTGPKQFEVIDGVIEETKFKGMRSIVRNEEIFFSLRDFSQMYADKLLAAGKKPWVIPGDGTIIFYGSDGSILKSTTTSDEEAIIIIEGNSYINVKYFPAVLVE